MKRVLSLLLFTFGLLVLQQTGAQAADFTVNNNGDATDANTADGVCATAGGVCTLRAAIVQAEALSGKDTVSIPAMTITLNALIAVSKSTDIRGAGARSTIITGTPGHVLFSVSGGDLSFTDMAFQGASSSSGGGGLAIYQNGVAATTLNRVRIINNTITGVTTAYGPVYVYAGEMTIDNSEISGNTATAGNAQAYGGGVFVTSTGTKVLIRNSTITGNRITSGGSGAFGGGVFTGTGATVTIQSSTVAGNSATNTSSIAASGGNLANQGSVSLSESIVSGGSAALSNTANCYLAPTFSGRNIISDTTCGAGSASRIITDPQLGALADNGGPTNTAVPALGSAAINAASTCVSAADQRGQTRPIGAACDLGAAEIGADLGVSLSASNTTPAPGSDVVFTATVANAGMDDAGSATAQVAFTGITQIVSTTTTQGSCAANGTAVDCTLGTAQRTAPVQILIVARAPQSGAITASATTTSAWPDPNPGNNSASVNATVSGSSSSGKCQNVINGTKRPDTLPGTAASDKILGRGANDRIRGLAGDDCLSGHAGADRIDAGPGKDKVSAGAGKDTVRVRDKSKDTVKCGAGFDTVIADRKDKVAKDCERIRRR